MKSKRASAYLGIVVVLLVGAILFGCGSSRRFVFQRVLVLDEDVTGTNVNVFTSNGSALTFVDAFDLGLDDPETILVHPVNGDRVYIADEVGDIAAASLNASGSLTLINALTGQGFNQWDNNQGMAISPDGKFIYVADSGDHILCYSVDPTTGAIAHVAANDFTSASPGAYITSIVSAQNAANGKSYVYVVAWGFTHVGAFEIDTTTGALTIVSEVAVPTSVSLSTLVADKTGKYLYVSDEDDPTVVWQYVVATDGTLSLNSVANSVTLAGALSCGGEEMIASPDNKHVYVGDSCTGPHGLTINADGTLTELTGSPFAIPTDNSVGIALDKSGAVAYVADWNDVYVFSRAADGTLTNLSGTNPAPTALGVPAHIATID
ncbi:MAG: lactonase family protein [Terriglobales bacterium]